MPTMGQTDYYNQLVVVVVRISSSTNGNHGIANKSFLLTFCLNVIKIEIHRATLVD